MKNSLKELKIAVFEDHETLRNALCQLINHSEGMVCSGTFSDAENLEEKIENFEFDFVIMDIDLPGKSGIMATQQIKSIHPEIQVLILTVFEDDEKIFQAICAGANGYILKNSSPAHIIQCINEIRSGGAPMSPMVARKVLENFKKNIVNPGTKAYDLSVREREILQLITQGMSYKLIAQTCYISIDTVKFHAKNIYEKLQVHSKSEAIVLAIRHRIV